MRTLRILAVLAVVPLLPLLADEKADFLALGKEQYAACMTCHGPDGKGMKAGDVWLAPSLYDRPISRPTTPAPRH